MSNGAWAIVAVIYFLPSLSALGHRKHNVAAIFTLNLLLGWTVLGWIVALIWSEVKDAPRRE